MKLRAGLLLERAPSIFTLPHRTFQEYLAGAHLAAQADFARQARELSERWDVWRQVILLAVGRLVYLSGTRPNPWPWSANSAPGRGRTNLAWRRAWLAGEVLLEMGLNRVREEELGRDLLERVQHRLVALLEAGALTPVERAEAGDVLAALGDPRFRADAWYLPDDPMLGFVEIPAGPFIMGSDKSVDPTAELRETPPASIRIFPAFYMARFPVTVAQWRVFVETTEYRPKDSNSLEDAPNRPVRSISWYEAILYCRWLNDLIRRWSGAPNPVTALLRYQPQQGLQWTIALPSEAEWENRRRGGLSIPQSGGVMIRVCSK